MAYVVKYRAAKYYQRGGNAPPRRIVIHTAQITPKPGAAAAIANYFAKPDPRKVSAHATVDNAELWRSVDDGDIAFHAPPNTKSLGIELATKAEMSAATWRDPYHRDMVANAADYTRMWCNKFGIPMHWLTVDEARGGGAGICSHLTVARAFGKTNHGDPGPNFPVADFMAMVNPNPAPGARYDTPSRPAVFGRPVMTTTTMEEEVFIYTLAGNGGKFLFTGTGTVTLKDLSVYDELRRKGIPDRGDLDTHTHNFLVDMNEGQHRSGRA